MPTRPDSAAQWARQFVNGVNVEPDDTTEEFVLAPEFDPPANPADPTSSNTAATPSAPDNPIAATDDFDYAEFLATFTPNLVEQSILSVFGASVYDPMTRMARYTVYHLASVRPLPDSPPGNRGRRIRTDLRLPDIVRASNNDFSGTGYDRGHNFASGMITRSINPLVDPCLTPAFRKILSIVHEHQRMTSGQAELERQERENKRVKALVKKKLRENLVSKAYDRLVVALQVAIPIFVLTRSTVGIYGVVGTSCLITACDFYDASHVESARVPAPERVTDVLHAHQTAQSETYQTSNMTMQYGEYCNNGIVSHVEGMIRGICDPDAGGGHIVVYAIPYFRPMRTPELASARQYREYRNGLYIEVQPCSDGGWIWVPHGYFMAVLAFDQTWSRKKTPQELVQLGNVQPIEADTPFDPTIETRDIAPNPKFTGWDVFAIGNGPINDSTVQLIDLTHYSLDDVTRMTGVKFPPSIRPTNNTRLSNSVIEAGPIRPNVPVEAIANRQGRVRPDYDPNRPRSAATSPW